VAEEMHAAAKAMQGAFAAKPGVRFSLQLAEDAGMVVIDRDRLRQMILNLLSNAIKYTDMGTVRLYAGPTPDGGLRIAVADTGAGVAEDDRERVFQKFYQGSAQNPDDAKPAGTGLGLAICKNIVEHYGGEIRLESRVGHGSTFIVEFPSAIRPEKGGPAVFPPSHTP
jgi:signal transduction histidine kinase